MIDQERRIRELLPSAALHLSGSACDSSGLNCRTISSDPTIQSNIQLEQSKLEKKASPFRFYPVISFGFGFGIGFFGGFGWGWPAWGFN